MPQSLNFLHSEQPVNPQALVYTARRKYPKHDPGGFASLTFLSQRTISELLSGNDVLVEVALGPTACRWQQLQTHPLFS